MLILVLLFCAFALPTSAAGIDYNDYITNVVVDGDNDLVTVAIPGSMCYVEMYDFNNNKTIYSGSGASHEIELSTPVSYLFRMHVFGYPWETNGCLDISNIPVGTVVRTSFSSDIPYEPHGNGTPGVFYTIYRDAAFNDVSHASVDYSYTTGVNEFNFTLSKPSGAIYLELENSVNFAVLDKGVYAFQVNDTVLEMSISSLYRLQQETGKTNAILTEVEKQLEANGQTLQEVLQQQQQTNDKLDKLPGQIGDEMQGIIDNEKEESKSEGNKFVDQILDALPDPSQDVLAALKGLTDATAYTGTDAVLPIPAIVLPGIDGLFPETEIWGGTQFDFGEYIALLPSSLLILVQSLFTIAIVIFCVFELKGIISYCLTLRESKGG